MQKIPFVLLSILSLCSFSVKEKLDNSLPIGSIMPKTDLKLKDVSGKEISLQEARRENGLLVMFSCNSCPYVIRNQSRTKEICGYALDKNVGVIVLNSNEEERNSSESLEAMQSYAKNQQYRWFYSVDKRNELADSFGASRTPECFLFDKSGRLVYHGAIDDSPGDANSVKRQHLREAINEMLAGKNVIVKESRSVGCSIHRV